MNTMGARSLFCVAVGISAVALSLLLSGCIKSKVVMKVKKDGSGDIVVTNIFSKESVAMYDIQMKQIRESGGGAEEKITMKDPFYDEERIRKDAKKFGPDVQFVKAIEYDKDGCRGYIAQYSFPDVNKVNLGLKNKAFEPEMPIAPEPEGAELDQADKAKDSFIFKFEKGDTSKLKIIAPPIPEKKAEATAPAEKAEAKADVPEVQTPEDKAQAQQLMANGNPLGLTGNETQEQFARKMFSGMRITVSVEVEGTDVKSNATYKTGDKSSRCTLFDMDMDRLMEIPSFMKKMMGGAGPGEELLQIYSSVPENPGFIIEKNKETVVEFK